MHCSHILQQAHGLYLDLPRKGARDGFSVMDQQEPNQPNDHYHLVQLCPLIALYKILYLIIQFSRYCEFHVLVILQENIDVKLLYILMVNENAHFKISLACDLALAT